jgi:hypothetical protein
MLYILHIACHSPRFSSLVASTARKRGAPTCLIKSCSAVNAYPLFLSGYITVYPLSNPRNTCAQVYPLDELVSEKKVSELKPSFSLRGHSEGSRHLKCLLGATLFSASTDVTSCVVAARVCLVVSRLSLPSLLLQSVISSSVYSC